jgi:hypothetical protein
MRQKAKSRGQKSHQQEATKRASVPAKENEFREIKLEDYVREFSLRGETSDAGTARFIQEISSSLGWPQVTFVRKIKDSEPPLYTSQKTKEQAIADAHGKTRMFLDMLRASAAGGDGNSLSEFVQLLAKNVTWLEGYSHREKGNLKELAAYLGMWPAMFNRRPRKKQQVAAYLARIGLAAEFDPDLDWHYVAGTVEAKDPEPTQFSDSEAKDRAVIRAICDAGRLFEELQLHVADGNLLATVKFVQLLEAEVTWLESYSIRDNDNLKAIASLTPDWPTSMARCPRRTKAAVEYLKRIKQGTKAQISLSSKWGNSHRKGGRDDGAIATRYARGIRMAVLNARNFFQSYDKRLETNGPLSRAAWEKVPQWIKAAGNLSRLTKKSAPKWFEIGWQLLFEKNNGHPERDPTLGKLCDDFRANKYARRYAKIAGPFSSEEILNRKESPTATADADRRSRIKERILNALISLAPPE